ncbi:thiopurine S-methyltransferase [Alcanivorax sp. S71-1-4]|jgi:thiopurine S-methyltransferase|uniref:thiopurine S-methyltransferase n=1 Tax=Alcanivorax sp. S71-1-4 TaxID=1177159 RepID=UPI001358FA48|nr:thiopurine S-methyltransferase [Alcanivorax sp. S71-1-4]KAF0811101.1 thiopurine S-methyltransferase [Alcanivorax sp. S71-1-4]
MEAAFWHRRWQNNEIGFHQPEGHRWLPRHWPALGLAPEAPVLVPLCGKSEDMHWLQRQGHPVVGAELSRAALEAFLSAHQLTASWQPAGALTVAHAPGYSLYCGDFFSLTADDIAHVQAVYDRAALIALPPLMRERYVAHLRRILPAGWRMLLVSLEYDQSKMDGPPFSVSADEVERLFHGCAVRQLEVEDASSGQPRFEEAGLNTLRERAWLIEG